MPAYRGCGPGFDSQWHLSSHKFSTSVSETHALDVGLFLFFLSLSFLNSLVEPHLITSFLFPLEFLCKAVQIKQKVSILCLCTLSLSVLVPSYQDETGVARLQWRHETFGSWAGMITSYICCFSIENPYILRDKRPFLPTENKSGFCHCLKRSHQVSSRDVVCLTNCFKEFHPITRDISAGLSSKSFYRAYLSVLFEAWTDF